MGTRTELPLYETAAIDLRVYGTAILLLLLVVASAAALPAARAARVSPVTALRED